MFVRHPSHRLAAYCDGQLPAAEARAIESHLATCERCRRECGAVRFAASALGGLALESPPASTWDAIDRRLRDTARPVRVTPPWQTDLAAAGASRRSLWRRRKVGLYRRLVPVAVAASFVLLAATGALYWLENRAADGPWQVAMRQSGGSESDMRRGPGDWVETARDSRARIVVGSIGTIDVEPNARLRLGAVTATQYRLSLERGTISAVITAPPRMFVVDTPATTVIDLGCAYTVTVGLDGAMELHMTSGWAALEWEGTETLVPAGAMSRTRKGRQPGLPYFEDAPSALQQAIAAIDADGETDENLDRVLQSTRERDTVTLWHLLSRTEGSQRVRVYERLQGLVPMPAGVTRERVLQLDPDALRTWREELAWHW